MSYSRRGLPALGVWLGAVKSLALTTSGAAWPAATSGKRPAPGELETYSAAAPAGAATAAATVATTAATGVRISRSPRGGDGTGQIARNFRACSNGPGGYVPAAWQMK